MTCEAQLLWYETEEGEVTEKSVEVYVEKSDVTGTEFYKSYEAGINTSFMLKTYEENFELSKHIDSDTKRVLYASKVLYEGAIYNIIRHYNKRGEVWITCG